MYKVIFTFDKFTPNTIAKPPLKPQVENANWSIAKYTWLLHKAAAVFVKKKLGNIFKKKLI